jgi:protein-tyrosine phosphatase
MAEAIFNNLCTHNDISAASAGLSVVKSSKTSKNSAILVKQNCSIDISEREAMQLTESMLKDSDLILTMTAYMRELLSHNFKSLNNKIYSLNEFVGIKGDIVDPFGGDISIYSKTFNELKNSILLLLDKLEDKSTL